MSAYSRFDDAVVTPPSDGMTKGGYGSGNVFGMPNNQSPRSGLNFTVPVQANVAGVPLNVGIPVNLQTSGVGVPGMNEGLYQAQQMAQPATFRLRGAWSDGLFDCNGDGLNCGSATLLYLIPYLATSFFGWLAYYTGSNFLFIVFLPALIALGVIGGCYRSKVREKFQINGIVLYDAILHMFCACCALAQEARHVDRDSATQV